MSRVRRTSERARAKVKPVENAAAPEPPALTQGVSPC